MPTLPEGVVSLREQHAAVTRRAILRAARRLFAEQGFTNTPVRALAQEAGVAVQTVYATFGSKGGVLAGLPDLLDEEAGVLELALRIQATRDPGDAVALQAHLQRTIRERCGDIVQILKTAAASDPAAAATWAEGRRRRRFGMERLAEGLQRAGVLKPGLTRRRATDIAMALSSDDVMEELVREAGWSFDAYERWLAQSLRAALTTLDD